MSRWLLGVLLVSACTPEPGPTHTPQGGTPGGTPTTPVTGTVTGTLTDSGTTTPPTGTTATTTYDCTLAWPATQGATAVGTMPSTEDFDITADGYVVHVESSNLVLRDYTGVNVTVVSPNVTSNASGTRVLSTGDIVVADVTAGTLWLVERATGNKTPLWYGNWPNGIDTDRDDNVYITDFADNGSLTRINAYNPQDREVIVDGVYRPNGVVLSPDYQTLYIAANWENAIYAIERNLDGTWGDSFLFQDNPGSAQSVTTDACGTVYWEKSNELWRRTADRVDAGNVAVMGQGYFPNIRFGNDVGGFKRDYIYGLSNNQLVEVHVGVPGKKHVSIQ